MKSQGGPGDVAFLVMLCTVHTHGTCSMTCETASVSAACGRCVGENNRANPVTSIANVHLMGALGLPGALQFACLCLRAHSELPYMTEERPFGLPCPCVDLTGFRVKR